MGDRELLAGYVETWWAAAGGFLTLLEELGPDDWATPTDLPGWDVKAVASHTAHLEGLLAGGPDETVDLGDPPPAHVTSPMGQFTEIGVVGRRDREPASIIDEIRTVTDKRRAELEADPPADAQSPAPGIFGAIGWTTRTLLRNRPLDIWMHEQDIRRATGRPGGMDSPGAQHAADYLSEGFGFVVGKRVAPPAGTTAVLSVEGSTPVAVQVGNDGRARRLTVEPEVPTVRVVTDRNTFIVLAGGRRKPADVDPDAITVEGDRSLGQLIIDNLATTP